MSSAVKREAAIAAAAWHGNYVILTNSREQYNHGYCSAACVLTNDQYDNNMCENK